MRARFIRFLLVGVLNTAVGVGVIAGGIILGLPPLAANALGFLVGLCVSFAANSQFTFQRDPRSITRIVRYIIAFFVAYACNLVVVLVLDFEFPSYPLVTHVAGIVPYTIVFFLIADRYVFGEQRRG